MLSYASDKAKLFAENYSKKFNLDDLGISLRKFPSMANLKLNNISLIPKFVTKVITGLDSSKAPDLDCIPMMVLKNCGSEFLYILTELFNMSVNKSYFPDFLKISSVDPVFKNVRESSTGKNYRPVNLLSAFFKIFTKIVNDRLVDHDEKCGLTIKTHQDNLNIFF